VFALAVMKLAETGTIDLDTDVNDYLKSWHLPVFLTVRLAVTNAEGSYYRYMKARLATRKRK
jgi:CubicO group peptidase (beta-lactamase class C family)